MRKYEKRELPKVALVRGPVVSAEGALNNEATPAIGLAYVAGSARQLGYDVTIVDAIGEGLNQVSGLDWKPGFITIGLTVDETVARIPEDTGVVGVSGMFSGEWPVVRKIIETIRARFPDALIVAGGEHATALPEFALRDCPALDMVVKGEGEATFVDVLEAYRQGTEFPQIGGICFLGEDGRFFDNGGLPRMRDLEVIPRPYWPEGYLEKFWEHGKSFGVQTARDMPMLASRGCPYQCTFCSSPSMWTTRYVLRDVDDLLDEINEYRERYDITAIQFYDLTAITKKRWIVEFCTKMLEQGINLKWSLPSGTRSEALDHETLSLMQATNCNYLVYAPESGAPGTLEAIQKRITLDSITGSIRTAKEVGLILRANLIIGFPNEGRREIYQTLMYGLKLSALGVDEVPVFIYSAYPGSQLFRDLLEAGKVSLDDEYFFGLTALNSKFNTLKPKTYNKHVPAMELAIYRSVFMLGNYLLGYLLFPSRILRTLKNLKGDEGHQAMTVLEHRIKDARLRKKAQAEREKISA
tara:strand:+ start:643 stop:2220 length:1578 start_codon:yes stop_codon:yes gene_type:complete